MEWIKLFFVLGSLFGMFYGLWNFLNTLELFFLIIFIISGGVIFSIVGFDD